ncbi:hypothetical protein [Paenibacillus brevis]|uniref:Uncharacterized protein n=1 Tax=Paenibacillus brevis TaxID=2841508 RepID=A0ABS6FJC1_9BACL|nr:hypothetical protein [Paenibacillus brevis]MBU5670272.1 hypothetical protein [Paenibacillus brevis]
MNPRALKMIEAALHPLIKKGRRVERIKLVVSSDAPISTLPFVQTRFGSVRVAPDGLVRKGLAYLMEEPGLPGRGFAWVFQAPTPKVER